MQLKLKNRIFTTIKYFIGIILFLVLWNHFTDWALQQIEDPIATYNIDAHQASTDDELLQIIATELTDKLDTQIIIVSPQRICLICIAKIFINFPLEKLYWMKHLQFNFDLLNYFYRRFKDRTPYGGFILYDYNVGHYNFDQFKQYTSYLKNVYRVEIVVNFSNSNRKSEKITIFPWIVDDCNLQLTTKPYCRNFKLKTTTAGITFSDIKVEEIYSLLGLDSSLSPVIDHIDVEKTCSDENPIVQGVVKSMYNAKHLPVLKHFLYDESVEDSHNGSYIDYRTIEDILTAAQCYSLVNDLGIPFAIMPSHFYLNAIDAENILTKSLKFQKFIEKNYPNAYTISDEISMKGYSKTENFSERVSSNSSDMMLMHGGTVKFWKRHQIRNGVKSIQKPYIFHKIKRALELKMYYGLLKISDLQ